MHNNVVIVGGGIAGLVSALLLSQNSQKNITIIERDLEVGGLLKKIDYGKYGFFDQGAHNLLETGIDELDKLLFSLLSEEEWEVLEGNKREISGSYFNGKFQKNSPYIDLRYLENYSDLLLSFIKSGGSTQKNRNNLYNYFQSKFGLEITKILEEIIENLYEDKLENLNEMASVMTPLSRVVLFENEFMDELNHSNKLKSSLAYPEQRELDLKLSSGRKALYPKYYGMYRLIDALVVELEKKGVKILTSTSIENIIIENDNINKIILSSGIEIDSVSQCIWSVGGNQLLSFLKLKPTKEFDTKKIKTALLNLVITHKLDIDDVYYFYVYSKESPLFRVTAYYNYCQNTKREGGYPISVEILDYKGIDNIEEKVIKELKEMKVLTEDNKILFSKLEILTGGFVHPSMKNSHFFEDVRNLIKNKKIKNLTNIGIMSEENLFFQTDILIDLYSKLRSFYD